MTGLPECCEAATDGRCPNHGDVEFVKQFIAAAQEQDRQADEMMKALPAGFFDTVYGD